MTNFFFTTIPFVNFGSGVEEPPKLHRLYTERKLNRYPTTPPQRPIYSYVILVTIPVWLELWWGTKGYCGGAIESDFYEKVVFISLALQIREAEMRANFASFL